MAHREAEKGTKEERRGRSSSSRSRSERRAPRAEAHPPQGAAVQTPSHGRGSKGHKDSKGSWSNKTSRSSKAGRNRSESDERDRRFLRAAQPSPVECTALAHLPNDAEGVASSSLAADSDGGQSWSCENCGQDNLRRHVWCDFCCHHYSNDGSWKWLGAGHCRVCGWLGGRKFLTEGCQRCWEARQDGTDLERYGDAPEWAWRPGGPGTEHGRGSMDEDYHDYDPYWRRHTQTLKIVGVHTGGSGAKCRTETFRVFSQCLEKHDLKLVLTGDDTQTMLPSFAGTFTNNKTAAPQETARQVLREYRDGNLEKAHHLIALNEWLAQEGFDLAEVKEMTPAEVQAEEKEEESEDDAYDRHKPFETRWALKAADPKSGGKRVAGPLAPVTKALASPPQRPIGAREPARVVMTTAEAMSPPQQPSQWAASSVSFKALSKTTQMTPTSPASESRAGAREATVLDKARLVARHVGIPLSEADLKRPVRELVYDLCIRTGTTTLPSGEELLQSSSLTSMATALVNGTWDECDASRPF